jgi:AraC-like DNA-binding protein
VSQPPLCTTGHYAPFVLWGESSTGERGERELRGFPFYQICLLQRGRAVLNHAPAGLLASLAAPAGLLLPPGTPLRVRLVGHSSWQRLAFDVRQQPVRVVGAALRHLDGELQPPPAAVWGRDPGVVVPEPLLPALERCLREASAWWWRGVLGRLRASHLLGLWLLDLLADEGPRRGDPWLDGLEQLVRRQAYQGISAVDIARHAGLSTDRLARRIRDLTGRPTRDWLIGLRLDAACARLRQNGSTVREAAELGGWRSLPAFIRAFTAVHGVPPGTWRRAATDQANSAG